MDKETVLYDDIRLFYAYQKAYFNNMQQFSHFNGINTFEAISKAIYNAFAKDSDKLETFSDMPDIISGITLNKVNEILTEDELYRRMR